MAAIFAGLALLWASHVQAEGEEAQEEDWVQVASFNPGGQTATFVDGDVVYAAHRNNSERQLSVHKFENGGWVQLGPVKITERQVDALSIYVDHGIPYVAYQEFVPLPQPAKSGVTVLQYDADQNMWIPVGERLFYQAKVYGYINKTRLAVDNGNVYVAISEFVSGTDYVSHVMKYSPDTGEWEELGGDEPLDSSLLITRDLEMQVVDGAVYLSRVRKIPGSPSTSYYALVHKFDDTVPDGRWEDMTSVSPEWMVPSDSRDYSTRVDQNKLYLAHVDFYGRTHVYVGEQNWQHLGTLGIKADYGSSVLTQPVIRWYNGLMYVAYAYTDSDLSRAYLAVSRYDGSNWTMLGSPIPSSERTSDSLYRLYDYLSLHVEHGVLTLGAIDAGTGQYKVYTYTDSIELDTPPAVAADPLEKGMSDAFELTFADNEDWRERIERITADGKTLYRDVDYTIAGGKITILPGAMPAAGFVTINIMAEGYLGVPVVQKVNPSAPSNAWVPSAGDSYVKVAWNAVPGVDSYRIYYSTSPDPLHAEDAQYVTAPYNLIAKERVISSLRNGTTYYFAVTSMADGLESPPTNVVSATPAGKTDEGNRPWQLLDSSFHGLSPSLFLDGDTVYVIYREDGATTVLKWEEDTWVPVGERKFSVGNGFEPDIYVDQQVPYAVYRTQDRRTLVMKFDGEGWVPVGDALSAEESHHFSMVVHEGIPYVAYVESRDAGESWYLGAMKVKRLSVEGDPSGEWTAMGDFSLFTNVRSNTVMLRYDGDRHLFVSFRDETNDSTHLYRWDLQGEEPAWQEVGLPEEIAGAGFASMDAVPDSVYYLVSVSGGDQPGGTLELWKYDRTGETWTNLGGGFPGSAGALTVDREHGVPHVAYTVWNGAEMEAIVQKHVNGQWYPFGSKVYPQGTSMYDLDLAVNNYKPYVVYSNNGNSVEVRTLTFDAWCTVTFDPKVEGSSAKSVSLPCGEPLPEPAPHAQKANYFFEYWTADGETPFDFTMRIETDLELAAVWNLSAPEHAQVTAHGDGTLTLEWDPVAGAAGYRIYRGESADAIDTFVDEVTETTYTDTGLTNGKVYYYAVTATDGTVESKRSAAADGKPRTIPQVPQNVEAELIDEQTAVLTFAKPGDGGSGITGYRVMVVPDEQSGLDPYPYGTVFDPAMAGDEEVELEIEGLEYNIGYRFRVAAENSEGWSDWSALSERVVPRLICSYLLYDKDGTDAVEWTQPCLDPVPNTKDRVGFAFAGWHLDDEVTQAFVPADEYAGETVTLYAKWIRTGDPLPENEWFVLDHMVEDKYHLHSIVHEGNLYTAYWDNGYLTVRKFDGRQWVTVGSPRFVPVNDTVFEQKAALFAEDETLYVLYSVLDANAFETALRFSRIGLREENPDWEDAWEDVTFQLSPMQTGFVVHQGVPYVSYFTWTENRLLKWSDDGWEAVDFPDSDQFFDTLTLTLDQDRLYLFYSFLDMTTFETQRRIVHLDLNDAQAGWAEVADLSVISDWYPGSALGQMSLAFSEGTPAIIVQTQAPDGSIRLAVARERNGEWVKTSERVFEAKPNVQQVLYSVSFVMGGQTPYLLYTRNEIDLITFTSTFEHMSERLHGTGSAVIGNGPVEPVMDNVSGLQLLKSGTDLYAVFTTGMTNQTLYHTLNLPLCEVVFYDSDQTELGRQTVICGETATEPSPYPEREHHDFAGWYADEEGTLAYDFSQPVETDLALYAKWEPRVPSAPEQVAVKEVGDGYVKIEWATSPLATKYHIYMSVSEHVYGARVATVTDTKYTAEDLENGTTYYFAVTAENDAGESGYSAQVSAKPDPGVCTVSFNSNGGSAMEPITVPCGDAAAEPDTEPVLDGYSFEGWYADPELTEPYGFGVPVTSDMTLYAKWRLLPPPAPENVHVIRVGDGYATIGWNLSPGAARYHIYMSVSEHAYGARVATVTEAVYAAAGLENGTTYYFAVTAESDEGGESGHSAKVSATPQRDACTISFNSNGGSAVASITVPCGDAAAEPDAEPTLDGYSFEGWYADPELNEPYEFGVPVTSDMTLYAKWALLPPDAPGNVTVSETGSGYVKLQWSPSPRAAGYYVYVSLPPGGEPVKHGSAPQPEYTAVSLTNGVTHSFTVTAWNESGESDPSSPVQAVPAAPPDDRDDEQDDEDGQDGEDTGGEEESEPAESAPEGQLLDIIINGKPETAGRMTTSENNGRLMTVIGLDEDRIEQRLIEEGEQAVITILVDTDSEVVIGELTGRIVKRMEEQRTVIEIHTGRGAYRIPAHNLMIDEIAERLGSGNLQEIKVRIEIEIPEEEMARFVEDAANARELALVVPPLEFTVRAIHDDRTEEISAFQEFVERLVAIPGDVDANRITTGVYIGPDGSFHHVPTRIVVIDGKTYARINSLTNSVYSVIWHQAAFTDIHGHWAGDIIGNLGNRLVLSGYADGSFRPDQPITRAEFAAYVVRGLGLSGQQGAVSFTDVSEDDWYHDVAATASEYGLIRGLADGRFAGSDPITREQAMTIIARAMALAGLQGVADDESVHEILRPYTDAARVSEWARRDVATGVRAGIVFGKDHGGLAPKDMLSRAEAAVLIYRLLVQSGLIDG
jgi:uncharacterized repeat protein (TIGR02543 family)